VSPEVLALDQQRAVLARQQEMAYRADLVNHAHVTTCASVFAVLLDKWFERHQRIQGGFPTPTANDLRWLAKMAFHYAIYVPDAAKLCKVDDSKLDALAGINRDDAFSFAHLFAVKDPSKSLAEPIGEQP
jgi:hypothetical protein